MTAALTLPTVGDVVHYTSHGTPYRLDGTQAYPPLCRAALVTQVGAWIDIKTTVETPPGGGGFKLPTRIVEQWFYVDACHLDVRNPTGGFFNICVHDEAHRLGGTWHWPEGTES